MSTVEKQGDVYYWVYEITTCECDKMYCKGCKAETQRREIKEKPFDCPKCQGEAIRYSYLCRSARNPTTASL